jgi:hypothetical protein
VYHHDQEEHRPDRHEGDGLDGRPAGISNGSADANRTTGDAGKRGDAPSSAADFRTRHYIATASPASSASAHIAAR